MPFPTISRRSGILLGALSLLVVIAVLHAGARNHPAYLSWPPASDVKNVPLVHKDEAVRRRFDALVNLCAADDPFELEYGRTNLRLSRGYEGSQNRVRRLLHKILRGEKFTISAIGGSVTQGHAVYSNEAWFYRFGAWMQDFVGDDIPISHVNGAAPATGSDYFSFCFPLHIPRDSDLILVELGVNDQGIPEHVENMENLLRGLLDLPHKPAVILVEAAAFDSGGMGGGGGRMHLPVAQYYDVPVISQRHVMAAHLERYPQLLRHYFAKDWWGNPDKRHINSRGHRDLAMLVASFIRDTACTMISEPAFEVQAEDEDDTSDSDGVPAYVQQANTVASEEINANDTEIAALQDALVSSYEDGWPQQARAWRQDPEKDEMIGQLMPGMWMNPLEYGRIPRLRLLQGWDPDLSHATLPFHPMCMSTRSKDPAFNLTPSANDGWEHWVHPDYQDKPYLMTRTPGAKVTFQLETVLGVVKMYSLKSKTFGLGTIECWADEDRSESVKIEGYWDNGNANIGRFDTIRTDLEPGSHAISCQLLEETADPGGGHEFRMISIMSG